MVRIIGNSSERVRIPDLGDTVYYRQVKEYTDQEYESSRDLKRAIETGRVAKIAIQGASRGSIPDGQVVSSSSPVVSEREMRRIVREESSVKDAIPEIVSILKQEISDILRQNSIRAPEPNPQSQISEPATFVDPTFVPSVSTSGMTANINLESREIKDDDLTSTLEALRKMQKP